MGLGISKKGKKSSHSVRPSLKKSDDPYLSGQKSARDTLVRESDVRRKGRGKGGPPPFAHKEKKGSVRSSFSVEEREKGGKEKHIFWQKCFARR